MTRSDNRQFSIAAILLLMLIAALLIALPRLTAGAELHPTTILWFVTLHQIAIAATLATILWVLFARRTYVAVILATLIVVLWGPNLGATIEYSVTGKNTTFLSVANATGATPYMNSLYSTTYNLLGYNYKATQR